METARLDIFDYIEGFYNRRRCHFTLGYVSPAEHHAARLTEPKNGSMDAMLDIRNAGDNVS